MSNQSFQPETSNDLTQKKMGHILKSKEGKEEEEEEEE